MAFDTRNFHISNTRREAPAKLKMTGNVEVIGFDAKLIPTYAAFVKMKQTAMMKGALAYLEFLNFYRKAINYYERGDNLVVNVGSAWLANIITNTGLGGGAIFWSHCRVGSTGTAVVPGDVDVLAVIGASVAVTNAYTVSNVAHFDTFFSASANNGTWLETALASQSAAPDSTHPILARKVISSFVKDSTKTATIAWSITFTPV